MMMTALLLSAAAAFARPAQRGLTQKEAAARSAMVGDVSYGLDISLSADQPEFAGRATVEFDLKKPGGDLTVDFDGGTIESLLINGRPESKPRYNGLFLTLDPASLRRGENTVIIDFKRRYGANGNGLYRFKDPEDGRVYVYTDFEPYNANKLFPCFDQPDLKASLTLTVEAPGDWEVVTAASGTASGAEGARRTWTFEPTAPLSTYVFSLAAGPFKVWTDQAGDIPLRLFARQALAPHIDPKGWFLITKQGLGFYQDYFALKYPFKKYDQLVVPDFNSGAMENAGAVTFAEAYVKRSAPTRDEREELATVILHEMAHMWFGDLVTMRWWNGLWLNESFATYMEALSAHEATEFKDSWRSFFSGMKTWAYWEDQLVTTHPIEVPVEDTESAFTNFDGITYGKGASVLKQLAHLLGEETFRDGVRAYLKEHAYGNAQESDFFTAMEKASGKSLGPWTEQWLHTPGVNTLKAGFACGPDKTVSSFALLQSGTVLRRHRTVLGDDAFSVAYEGAETAVPRFIGRPCPAFVYPNEGDFDYVKVELDTRSLEAAKAGPSRLADPLMRAMLWHTLWQMVQDAKWPVQDYADLVFKDLGGEKDPKVAAAVLETIHGPRSVLHFIPDPDYGRFEAFFWENLAKAEPGSDLQKLWFDGFVKVAETPEGQEKLRRLLTGETAVPGMTVDQDRRWAIIVELNAGEQKGSEELLSSESRKDRSDKAVKAAAAAAAARPDAEVKAFWLAKMTGPKAAATLGELRPAMENLFPRTQTKLRARFAGDFFKALPELSSSRDDEFLSAFTQGLVPAACTQASAAALGDFLEKHPSLHPAIVKNLLIARQEDERCLKVRALLAR